MPGPKKRPHNAPDNGPGNGDHNGNSNRGGKRTALDWEDFIDELQLHHRGVEPVSLVCRANPNGNSWGAQLGTIELAPFDTLAQRIVAEWGGPGLYWVRPRTVGRGFFSVGRLEWGAFCAGRVSAPASSSSSVADRLVDEVLNDRHREPPKQVDPLDQLKGTLGLLQQFNLLPPAGGAAAAGAPAKQKTAKEVVDELKETKAALIDAGLAGEPDDDDDDDMLTKALPIVNAVGGFVSGWVKDIADMVRAPDKPKTEDKQ